MHVCVWIYLYAYIYIKSRNKRSPCAERRTNYEFYLPLMRTQEAPENIDPRKAASPPSSLGQMTQGVGLPIHHAGDGHCLEQAEAADWMPARQQRCCSVLLVPAGEGSGAGRLLPPDKSPQSTMGPSETTVSMDLFWCEGLSDLFRLDRQRGNQGLQRSARWDLFV